MYNSPRLSAQVYIYQTISTILEHNPPAPQPVMRSSSKLTPLFHRQVGLAQLATISNSAHPVKIGVSDAYYMDRMSTSSKLPPLPAECSLSRLLFNIIIGRVHHISMGVSSIHPFQHVGMLEDYFIFFMYRQEFCFLIC